MSQMSLRDLIPVDRVFLTRSIFRPGSDDTGPSGKYRSIMFWKLELLFVAMHNDLSRGRIGSYCFDSKKFQYLKQIHVR